jgi:transposase InsO family protein
VAGLKDRSSRPHRLHRPTPQAIVEQVERLRRLRWTGKQIGTELDISSATVGRIHKRLGLNKLSALEPVVPVRRYERERPGELIHIDIKKLGRFAHAGHRATGNRQACRNEGAGWEFVHVAIDDHSRVAFAKVMASEKKRSATAFLKAALAYYESLGIKIERVMTDNGSCYKSFAFRRACKRLGLRHIRTKPYTPKTNGKAERFIQTSLREWAYAQAYRHSQERKAQLPLWLHRYNWQRPHAGIDDRTPISRLGLPEDNLLRLHSKRAVASGPSRRIACAGQKQVSIAVRLTPLTPVRLSISTYGMGGSSHDELPIIISISLEARGGAAAHRPVRNGVWRRLHL